MLEPLQKASEDFQKIGKDNYDAVVRSYSELNKGLQAIGASSTSISERLGKTRRVSTSRKTTMPRCLSQRLDSWLKASGHFYVRKGI